MDKKDWGDVWETAEATRLLPAVRDLIAAEREQCVQLAKDPKMPEKETNMVLGGVVLADEILEEMERQIFEAHQRAGK